MKSWNKNYSIASILILLILFFSFLLYLDFKKRKDIGDRKVIGRIIYKQKKIQRKFDGDVVWETIERDTPVTNRDTIRSTDESTVEIKLNDNTEINLDENSMIVLDFSNDKIDLDFQYGSFKANKDNSENSKLNIKSGEKSIELENANASITKTNGEDINLSVEKGTALVKSKEGEKQLNQDEQATLSRSKVDVKQNLIKLKSPKDKSILISTSDLQTVNFFIETKSNNDSILEISNEQGFKKILKTANLEKAKNISMSLKPGIYFYRVKIKSENLVSNYAKFTILKDRKLEFSSPEKNTKYFITEKKAMVNFVWRESENERGYKLEIAKDKNFSELIFNQDIFKNQISLDIFPEGIYFARLKSIPATSQFEAQKSDIISFEIIPKKEKDKIIFQSQNNSKTNKLALEKKAFLISWKQTNDFKKYEVEISQSPDFQNSKKDFTNFNFYSPEFTSLGNFFLRVRGIAFSNDYSEYSQIQYRVLDNEKLFFISPNDKEELNLSNDSELEFKWTKPNFISNSVLEISTDSEFKNLFKKLNTNTHFLNLKNIPEGNYFARVKIFSGDDSNSEITSIPKINFKVLKILKPLTLFKPKSSEVLNLTDENIIRFEWEKINSKFYQFELFQKIDSSEKLILKEKTKDNFFELKDFKILDEGKFQWRVFAILEQNGKEITTPISKDFFSIYLPNDKNESPLILNPKKQHIQSIK